MDVDKFKVDHDADEEGYWEPIEIGDLEVKLRPAHSKSYRRARKKVEQRYQSKIRKGELNEDDKREILVQSIKMGSIVDWRNFARNGNLLPFDQANLNTIFSMDYRLILAGIMEAFVRVSTRSAEDEDEDEKKLESLQNSTLLQEDMNGELLHLSK